MPGFWTFSGFSHHFVLAKFVTSSISSEKSNAFFYPDIDLGFTRDLWPGLDLSGPIMPSYNIELNDTNHLSFFQRMAQK